MGVERRESREEMEVGEEKGREEEDMEGRGQNMIIFLYIFQDFSKNKSTRSPQRVRSCTTDHPLPNLSSLVPCRCP